jgi:hypothetical protein
MDFLSKPDLWDFWPFLPVVRRTSGSEEYGVLFDLFGFNGTTGFKATVFMSNIFLLPETAHEILALPREVFDTFEELYQAGWRVD